MITAPIAGLGSSCKFPTARWNANPAMAKELLAVRSHGDGGTRQGQVWEHEVLGSAALAQSGTASPFSGGGPCHGSYAARPWREEPLVSEGG
jgi:hypothetical protein